MQNSKNQMDLHTTTACILLQPIFFNILASKNMTQYHNPIKMKISKAIKTH